MTKTEMPEKLKQRRDELANEYSDKAVDQTGDRIVGGPAYAGYTYGFNAACEELAPVVEALRWLANEAQGFRSMANPHDHGYTNMVCLDNRIKQARQALSKLDNDLAHKED